METQIPEVEVSEYPMSAEDAMILHNDLLNEYERQEIQKFDNHIYYLGQNCKRKIKGHVFAQSRSPEYIQRHKERLK